MIDLEYELVRMKLREREKEAELMRQVREARAGRSWFHAFRRALGGGRAQPREKVVVKVLETDGKLTCPDDVLVHRPWRDRAA
ncbi:MAG: hypothetical protein DIU80_024970 [Chloroflexota bacterium]